MDGQAFILNIVCILYFHHGIFCQRTNEFGLYTVAELLSGPDCRELIRLSPEDDWKYGGQVLFDPAQDVVCDDFELTIIAAYELDYQLLFYIQKSMKANETESKVTAGIAAFHDSENASDVICEQCRQDSFTYTSPGNSLTLVVPGNQSSSWLLTFTLYRDSVLCNSFEYACAHNRCIFHSLNCNGNNPCGDHTDCLMSYPAMAAIAFGGFCVLGVIFLLLYILIKSRKSSIWSSREKQPRKFSPAKALQSIQSFTPVNMAVTPVRRRWSYKY